MGAWIALLFPFVDIHGGTSVVKWRLLAILAQAHRGLNSSARCALHDARSKAGQHGPVLASFRIAIVYVVPHLPAKLRYIPHVLKCARSLQYVS